MKLSSPSSTPRKRIFRVLGYAAGLTSTVTTVLFVLFSVATAKENSVFSIICIITAALSLFSVLSIGLYSFQLSPTLHQFRVLATIPSLSSSISATAALAWMSMSRTRLPARIVGTPATTMLVVGFSMLLLTAITQTFFWTTILISTTKPVVLPTHSRKPSKPVNLPFPSPAYKSTLSLHSTRSSFGNKSSFSLHKPDLHAALPPTTPPSIPPKPLCLMKAPQSPPEINHFDAWTTTDSTIASSVAESLRQIELEQLEADEEAEFGPSSPIDALNRTIQRQASPPLPEQTGRVRNFTFPGGGGCRSAGPTYAQFPGSPLMGPDRPRRGSAGMI